MANPNESTFRNHLQPLLTITRLNSIRPAKSDVLRWQFVHNESANGKRWRRPKLPRVSRSSSPQTAASIR
ncbi:MAG TPA: hypothetical protein DDX19_10200 [Rhodopirellula baltica]|uniref:Uncharacterized protein n=1 Tax=Rhodopirellula baltica (strain DSM 10527 / NCIMB 13988 / SH1) TaxID=243090 RepID=Q7UH26_RHOBA|nr:hypothetical protein RB4883 [Rhodopirellula baltica SH 1]HBE63093.1 hypothetical protein [Rhodopirellula baltica]